MFEVSSFNLVQDAGLFSLATHDFIENKLHSGIERKAVSLAYQVLSPETTVVGIVKVPGDTF